MTRIPFPSNAFASLVGSADDALRENVSEESYNVIWRSMRAIPILPSLAGMTIELKRAAVTSIRPLRDLPTLEDFE